ncbi:MAG: hypothetical protein HKP58_04775 [Desulfatitalea sp.]|nr:hypothetical protein [Desulfatitalea sp.]NNJ99706.1 hypothetical protein [Desulfatitalea sp.]
MARDRLPAYRRARNSFIRVGMDVEKTNDVVKLYKTVSEPLLSVIRKSSDFSAAYYPLLSIAYDIYPYDREASYQLLTDLSRANPMRREARILRQRLFVKHYNAFAMVRSLLILCQSRNEIVAIRILI